MDIANCYILRFVHVISRKALTVFALRHPAARAPLEVWYRLVSKSGFDSFVQIKQVFNSADYVAPYIVFDVGGNNFRVVTVIHFDRQRLYVRDVLTHAGYDRWTQAHRSKKS